MKHICATIGIIAAIMSGGCGRSQRADREYDSIPAEFTSIKPEPAFSAPLPEKQPSESVSASLQPDSPASGEEPFFRIPVRNIGHLPEVFNDSNHRQLEHARALGIHPIEDIRGAYHTSRPVILIESNSLYQVDSLTHSLPFLVPEAAGLLTDIARNFIDSLHSRGAEGYRIKVTSLLRTPHTVKSLRKVNINATEMSTHQFGTTFDISYTKFHCTDNARPIHDGDLKNLLAEVLLDLRDTGRCLVKFERKTACYHITATR